MEERYYGRWLSAYLRGLALRTGVPAVRQELLQKDLEDLSDEEMAELQDAGRKAEAKLYAFKTSHADLPRVRRVLGFLRSAPCGSLLDVGSGRGAFLFPFMEEFPWAQVTALDILPHRVQFLNDLTEGGARRLTAVEANICDQPFAEDSFDVVTMLEVLEHIPQVEKAVRAAVKMARNYVVVTAPSKPDDNPEHIRLLTKETLTELFAEAGCTRLRFDGVSGHLFLVASVGDGQQRRQNGNEF